MHVHPRSTYIYIYIFIICISQSIQLEHLFPYMDNEDLILYYLQKQIIQRPLMHMGRSSWTNTFSSLTVNLSHYNQILKYVVTLAPISYFPLHYTHNNNNNNMSQLGFSWDIGSFSLIDRLNNYEKILSKNFTAKVNNLLLIQINFCKINHYYIHSVHIKF